jgi:hypothetical protein
MCIICNCGDDGDSFLTAFLNSQRAMRNAQDWMRRCSTHAVDAESRKRYDATHKRMVKLMREWNALEEFRENHVVQP